MESSLEKNEPMEEDEYEHLLHDAKDTIKLLVEKVKFLMREKEKGERSSMEFQEKLSQLQESLSQEKALHLSEGENAKEQISSISMERDNALKRISELEEEISHYKSKEESRQRVVHRESQKDSELQILMDEARGLLK